MTNANVIFLTRKNGTSTKSRTEKKGRQGIMTEIMPEGVIRSCIVTHKVNCKDVDKKAIFHRWVQNVISNENTQIVQALALVEYEDGSVAQVSIKKLRFTDGLFDAYFQEEKDDEGDTEEQVPLS